MTRSIRIAILGGILIALVGMILSPFGPDRPLARLFGNPTVDGSGTGGSPNQEAAAGPPVEGGITPAAWRERVTNRNRLIPDQRFIDALRHVSDSATGAAAFQHDADGWHIKLGGTSTRLAADAGFETLLRAVRASVPPVKPKQSPPKDKPQTMRLASLLPSLPESLRDAEATELTTAAKQARVSARILLIQRDALELNERLAVHAIVSLAIAEEAGIDLPLPHSLIAWSLGYRAHARTTAAKGLASDHPWRAYLDRRTEKLPEHTSALGHYLRLRALAGRHGSDARWATSANAARAAGVGPVAIYQTGYRFSDFGPQLSSMVSVPHLAVDLAGGSAGPSVEVFFQDDGSGKPRLSADDDRASTLALFDRLIPEVEWGLENPPLSRLESGLADTSSGVATPGLATDTLRAIFYTAIYRRAGVHMDRRNDYDKVAELAAKLRGTDKEPAMALATLFEQRVAARRGELDNPEELINTASSLPLAPDALLALIDDALERLSRRPQTVSEGFRNFAGLDRTGVAPSDQSNRGGVRQLDARPSDEALLARYAGDNLDRPLLAERLRARVIDERGAATVPGEVIDHARAFQDEDALLSLARKPAVEPSWRSHALRILGGWERTSGAKDELQALAAGHPANWAVQADWIALLKEDEAHEQALEAVRRWRYNHSEQAAQFDRLNARLVQVELQLALGELEAATSLMERTLGFLGAASEYHTAIEVYRERGDTERVRRLATDLARRYYNAHSVGPLARVHWCAGELDRAAVLLSELPRRINKSAWHEALAPGFHECLGNRPEATVSATRSLQKQGLTSRSLRALAAALEHNGHPRTAYHVARTIQSPRRFHQGVVHMMAAQYRLQWDDPKATLAWLDERLPSGIRGSLSRPAFGSGIHEVLWELTPAPSSPPKHHDYVWAMRAASVAIDATTDAERRNKAVGALADGHTVHALGGRVLLNRADLEQLAKTPLRRGQLDAAAFYLGVQAVGDNRPEAALQWFAAAKAAGSSGSWMNGWARGILSRVAGNPAWRDDYNQQGAAYLMPWGNTSPP